MKAIFTGTLAQGFDISAVVDDSLADAAVNSCMANGQLAEALEIEDPTTMDGRAKVDPDGNAFIVYGTGIGNSFSVWGPFANDEDAEEFGEKNRADDDEWELFTCDRGAPTLSVDDTQDTPQKTLAAIVDLIDVRTKWWGDQVEAMVAKSKRKEESLSAWLHHARVTAPKDEFMAIYGLNCFVAMVDSHSLNWLNGDDNGPEADLLARARLHAAGGINTQEIKMGPFTGSADAEKSIAAEEVQQAAPRRMRM